MSLPPAYMSCHNHSKLQAVRDLLNEQLAKECSIPNCKYLLHTYIIIPASINFNYVDSYTCSAMAYTGNLMNMNYV